MLTFAPVTLGCVDLVEEALALVQRLVRVRLRLGREWVPPARCSSIVVVLPCERVCFCATHATQKYRRQYTPKLHQHVQQGKEGDVLVEDSTALRFAGSSATASSPRFLLPSGVALPTPHASSSCAAFV